MNSIMKELGHSYFKSHSTAFHCGRRLLCTFKEASPCKDCKRIKYRILYTTMYLYCAVMYVTMQPYREYISECRFVDHTQVFSIRSEVNRAIEPHQTAVNFSIQVVASLLLPYSPCIALYTIPMDINSTTCTQI